MIPEGPLFHKPKSFLIARQSIYASILVGVLSLLIRAASVGFTNMDGISITAGIVVFYVVIVLLVKQMSSDRKWARTAILVLYILAMIAYPVVMSEQIKASMLVAALLLIQAALVIYSLVLLYNTECNKWFNSMPVGKDLP